VVLLRTPYGRGVPYSTLLARPLARRGLQVVVQSVRGTFGSGGRLAAFQQERVDGVATVGWLRAQPWCDGRVAMAGISYLGYAQWAVAPYLDEPLAALAVAMAGARFTVGHPSSGSFPLHAALSWVSLLARQEREPLAGLLPNPLRARREAQAMHHLPLLEADRMAVGRRIDAWAAVVNHPDPADPFWAGTDHSERVPDVTSPVSMVAGWHDMYLPGQLRDFRVLHDRGRPVRITIGPWGHDSLPSLRAAVRDQLDWLPRHLRTRPGATGWGAPVRAYLQHGRRWLELDRWPPAGSAPPRSLRLQPFGRLGWGRPPAGAPDRFVYRPHHPTPSVGGPLISGPMGQRRNGTVEARPDVLVYTTPPLDADLDVVGDLHADVYLCTDQPHAQLFVRLCDVSRSGTSWNVCDGVRQLGPDDPAPGRDGVREVRVDLWPTAYRFRRGHRLRLQVSGGAFPRFPRSHGTGELIAGAVAMRECRYEILHDPEHPSRVVLPIYRG
jgi:putative CocE/NonD family hydrolase